MVCASCKSLSSHQVESFSCLSVGIPYVHTAKSQSSPITITDCFNHTFKEEVVKDKDDPWSCGNCGTDSAVKSTRVEAWPRVLLLHLKRFKPILGQYQKNQSVVEVGNTFEVEGEQYRVLAKVNHVGATMESGHYTADIRLDKWKRCDDRRIFDTQPQNRSQEVYMIFSERVKNR